MNKPPDQPSGLPPPGTWRHERGPDWAIVEFQSLRQITQEIGTPTEHMLAVLKFTFMKDGYAQPGMELVIKQLVGSKLGEDATVEIVGAPSHQIPVSNATLRDIAEQYYNKYLGMFGGGATRMYMENNEFIMPAAYDVKCEERKEGPW